MRILIQFLINLKIKSPSAILFNSCGDKSINRVKEKGLNDSFSFSKHKYKKYILKKRKKIL